jgi:hypothetical protein
MASTVISVSDAGFWKRGDLLLLEPGTDCEARLRVKGRRGNDLTVTRWRWWHTAANWPGRIGRVVRRRADDAYLWCADEWEKLRS